MCLPGCRGSSAGRCVWWGGGGGGGVDGIGGKLEPISGSDVCVARLNPHPCRKCGTSSWARRGPRWRCCSCLGRWRGWCAAGRPGRPDHHHPSGCVKQHWRAPVLKLLTRGKLQATGSLPARRLSTEACRLAALNTSHWLLPHAVPRPHHTSATGNFTGRWRSEGREVGRHCAAVRAHSGAATEGQDALHGARGQVLGPQRVAPAPAQRHAALQA